MNSEDEILLSEALRRAEAKGWLPDAIRDAIERGEIASRRDADGEVYVRWRDISDYVEALKVY